MAGRGVRVVSIRPKQMLCARDTFDARLLPREES
jgi:hypothetical protein